MPTLTKILPMCFRGSSYNCGSGATVVTRCTQAFTLIELLVVMGIVVLLMAFAVPTVNSIVGGRSVARSITDVTGMLELARAQAIARRSYVYVGFANVVNSDGNSELRLGAVASMDGTNNIASSNLQPITKVVRIPRMQMTNYSQLPTTVQSLVRSDAALSQNSNYVVERPQGEVQFRVGSEHFDDTTWTLPFAPEGDILSPNSRAMFVTQVAVGLTPTKGTTLMNTSNMSRDGAVVTVYGGIGQLRIDRP